MRFGGFQDYLSRDLGLAHFLAMGIWTEGIGALGSRELQHCRVSRGAPGVVCPLLIGPSLWGEEFKTLSVARAKGQGQSGVGGHPA